MQKLLFAFLLLTIFSCKTNEPEEVAHMRLRGETMGTYYAISYLDASGRDFKEQFDSLLVVINDGVSTYIPSSVISVFNKSVDGLDLGMNYETNVENAFPEEGKPGDKNWHFARNYYLSKYLNSQTGAAFDPTVMPLVNYWGFGYTEKRAVTAVDSALVDSLQAFVGMEKISLDSEGMRKSLPGVQLDFSAVAKGYAVDEVGRFLEMKDINDYLVEIGGEVRARGKSSRGDAWKIGINTPDTDAALSDIELLVNLADLSLATSGNYRNFYEVDGRKYAHTINPTSGYPEQSSLLSASVFAEDCAIADGLATAFMVMGLEASRDLLNDLKDVQACLIYGKEDGSYGIYMTTEIEKFIEQGEE